jgi:hypothetical protein
VLSRQWAVAALVLGSLLQGGPVAAQVVEEGGGIRILGPQPPTAPSVIAQGGEDGATLRAVRVPGGLDVDGSLDEPFYQTTPSISEFIQSVPDVGAEPTERTEAWLAFDDDNFYVSARIWDSAPESEWVANEMRRDSQANRTNDQFGVFLDTFYDRRNSIGIYVNPLGGFSDLQVTNEGNPNFDWNPVTDVRTGRFDGGWTVEIAIPFKSLRYRATREQVWGIQMRRSVMRRNEWSHITQLPLSVAGNGSQGIFRVSMYGTVVGIEAPPTSRNLELKPYAIAGLNTDRTLTPVVSNDGHADAGLDVKYGITENLTADLTFNTDFAQVEVDEQQVNLSRFSLFFPEKREFFLEGRGIFNFGSGGIGGGGGFGGGGGGTPTLFYSRRIGISGSQPVPILAGGRVTGKVGAFDIGAINIQTDDDPSIGAQSTNFSVFRLRRDILARSSLGALFLNRSHALAGEGSNQAYGVDAAFAFFENLSLLGYYAKTRTDDLTGNDESYRGQVSYQADEWGASVNHLLVGDDFNPEIGFVRRRDFRQSSADARFSPRTESIGWVRQLTFSGSVGYLTNERVGFVESRDRGGRFQAEFESGDSFSMGVTNNYERLIEPDRVSGALIPAGRYDFSEYQASYNFGPQRRVSGNVSFSHGDFFGGEITSFGLSRGRIAVLPQMTVEPSIEFNWLDFPEPIQEFDGQFDQHVYRTRVTYGFTPRMFVSGLLQYNDGSDAFSTNVRLRWEWAPGSELFIVYTEDRDTNPLEPSSRWSELSTRGFVVKVNRLFRL